MALDDAGDHAVGCPCGPLCAFRHDELADIWADLFEQAGAIARREVFVPELTGKQEAWLDVWAFGLPELPDALLDITVRHPRAQRYRPASERHAGACAQRAEAEKRDRYPAAGGRAVIPIVHETWGRLGTTAEDLLLALSAAAARRAYRRGRTAGPDLRKWRARLDAALQRSIAAQLDAAWNGLPGRPRQRRAPADLEALERCCPLSADAG